jgi:hypothetical protein
MPLPRIYCRDTFQWNFIKRADYGFVVPRLSIDSRSLSSLIYYQTFIVSSALLSFGMNGVWKQVNDRNAQACVRCHTMLK